MNLNEFNGLNVRVVIANAMKALEIRIKDRLYIQLSNGKLIEVDTVAFYGDNKSSRFCAHLNGKIVTQWSNARGCRLMLHKTSMLMWIQSLIIVLGNKFDTHTKMHSRKYAFIFITNNRTIQEHTKHLDEDCP